jgi:hypothetical protein
VGGRFAVGDDQHNLLGLRVPGQVPAGQHQGVLQVRPLDHVRAQLGQVAGAQLPGHGREADDLERVLRELRGHQAVQGQRGRLGAGPRLAQDHRVRQVDQ